MAGNRGPKETLGTAVRKGLGFGALYGTLGAGMGGEDMVRGGFVGMGVGLVVKAGSHIVKSVKAANDVVNTQKNIEYRRAARQAASERRARFAEGVNNSRD